MRPPKMPKIDTARTQKHAAATTIPRFGTSSSMVPTSKQLRGGRRDSRRTISLPCIKRRMRRTNHHTGDFYKASTIEELEKIVGKIKEKAD